MAPPPAVLVQGDDCNRVATFNYNGTVFTRLESACPRPIVVIALHTDCNNGTTDADAPLEAGSLQRCETGLQLNNGDRCKLPRCTD